MTEPTGAELKAMWQIHAADIGGIFDFARAVLAKWGRPAQAAEPVAVVVPCYTPSGKRVALCSAKQDLPIGTKLYTAHQPSPTAQADSVQEDAALWHWLAEYLVGPRTDLDDELVACETVDDMRKLVKAAIKQGATQ